MDELRGKRDAFSVSEQTTVTLVILKMSRETFPEEGFSVISLRMTLTLSVNVEQVICVTFVKDLFPLIISFSFSIKELNAALLLFNVFNFLIRAVLFRLRTKISLFYKT